MQRSLRMVAVLATLLAVIAVGPAAARKTKKKTKPAPPSFVIYHVVYEGSGTYSYKEDATDGSGAHQYLSSSFHWHADYPYLFVRRTAGAMAGTPTVPAKSSGGGTWSIDSKSGSSDGNGDCKSAGGLTLATFGGIQGTVQRSGALVATVIPGADDFTTTGGSSGSGACDTTDFWHAYPKSFSHIGSSSSEEYDPLTAFIHLGKQDFAAGKIVIPVTNHTLAAPSLTIPADCAQGSTMLTCTESFEWTGTVTLTKVNPGRGVR